MLVGVRDRLIRNRTQSDQRHPRLCGGVRADRAAKVTHHLSRCLHRTSKRR